MLIRAAFLVAALSGAANAETLVCPVGGERFEAPDVAVCGEYGGQTMLLMSVGCPPDTLPQCPQNFLPMYRAFSTGDMPLLMQYMQTESYESSVDFSPYFLAYNIEKFLNGPDKQLPALLLLWGLWHDPALISEDSDYMAALANELGAQHTPATPDENALILAMLAYTKLLGGDAAAGRAYFERAEGQNARSLETRAYLRAVGACFSDPSQRYCNATAAIPEP